MGGAQFSSTRQNGLGADGWVVIVAMSFASAVGYIAPLGEWLVLAIAGGYCWVSHTNGTGSTLGWKTLAMSLVRAAPALWGLMLLGALSALWALDPALTLRKVALTSLECFAGLGLCFSARRWMSQISGRVARWSLASACVVSSAALLDVVTGGALSAPWVPIGDHTSAMYDRGQTVHSMFLWPCVTLLWRQGHRKTAVVFTVLSLALLAFHNQATAFYAALAGGGVYCALLIAPRLKALFPIAAVVATLAAPIFASRVPPSMSCNLVSSAPSLLHRFIIWDFVVTKIMERPLLGWGMKSSRAIVGGKQTISLIDCAGQEVISGLKQLPLHPHNFFLQIWLELGGVGVCYVAAVMVLFLRRLASRGDIRAAGSCATATTGLVILSMSYGLWQGWFVAALLFTFAVLLPLLGDKHPIGTRAEDA